VSNGAELQLFVSPLEEERFGIRTARATNITRINLAQAIEFCQNHDVALLIARCHATQLDAVQEMERRGFFLADTLVYYGRNLTAETLPKLDSAIIIRPLANGENVRVQAIAEEAFSGYLSHYHADERLDKKQCDAAYKDWANKACSTRDDVHEVLVALKKGHVLAFAALRMNDPQQGECVLNGVCPSAKGRGIYQALITAGMHWCAGFHAREMIISSQIINIAVQKVWVRLGFEPRNYVYTFHKWFDF
jgi:GNAT superfamily N-acetyltransferase